MTVATEPRQRQPRRSSYSLTLRAGLYTLQQACIPLLCALLFLPLFCLTNGVEILISRVWTLSPNYALVPLREYDSIPNILTESSCCSAIASHELKLPLGGDNRSMCSSQQAAAWPRFRTCCCPDHLSGIPYGSLLAFRKVSSDLHSFDLMGAVKRGIVRLDVGIYHRMGITLRPPINEMEKQR